MKLIDRYIIISVTQGVLITLLILMSLAGFFSFLGQITDINKGSMTIFEGLKYVLYTLPRRSYELFPTAVLIGSLFSLGNLASNSELISIRAAGVSIGRITASVLKAGFILMLLSILIGEVIAPGLEHEAQSFRSVKLAGQISTKGQDGFWAREGDTFINIKRVISDSNVKQVLVYEFGLRRRLAKVLYAEEANYNNKSKKWYLKGVKESKLENKSVKIAHKKTMVLPKLIDPSLLSVLAVKPENLSMVSLKKYVNHLKKQNQEAARYEVAVWIKVFRPLSTLVMLLVAIPFVFQTIRTSNTGQRALFGILTGMVFFLLNQGVNQFGVVYGLPAIVSAGLPSVVFAIFGIIAIRRLI